DAVIAADDRHICIGQLLAHRSEGFPIRHLKSDVRGAYGATRGVNRPLANLFQREGMMLARSGEERIASHPLSKPKAEQAGIERHRPIEVADLEMHMAQAEGTCL